MHRGGGVQLRLSQLVTFVYGTTTSISDSYHYQSITSTQVIYGMHKHTVTTNNDRNVSNKLLRKGGEHRNFLETPLFPSAKQGVKKGFRSE